MAGAREILGPWRGLAAALILGLVLPLQPASAQDGPLTEAERSDWVRMTSHDGVLSYLSALQTLTDRIVVQELGRSERGRVIPAVFLGDPVAATPEAAAGSGKPTILIMGSIHGDEPVGRESLLQVVRDLTIGEHQAILRDVNLIVVPQMNPDGAEASSRQNALGYDLNRDWVVAESPEVSAVLEGIVTKYWPEVFLDVHNGGSAPYHLTFQTTLEPAADSELVRFTRGPVFEFIERRLESEGMQMFWYSGPAFDDARDQWYWRTTEPWPRKHHSYAGLRNMISILFEIPDTHLQAIGVEAARLGTLALLEFVAEGADGVREVVEEARLRTVEAPLDEVYLELEAEAYPGQVEFFVVSADESGGVVEERLVEGPNRTRYIPVRMRSVPYAYVFDRRLTELATLLRRHEIQVERLIETIELPVGRYTLLEVVRDDERYQNHRMLDLRVEFDEGPMVLEEGTFLVRVRQPAGRLIPMLLEPDAVDSLTRWNFLDALLPVPRESESFLPLARLEVRTDLPTMALP